MILKVKTSSPIVAAFFLATNIALYAGALWGATRVIHHAWYY